MDIVSWIFAGRKYDQERPIFIDALDPSIHISAKQARTCIRRLIAGFKKAGLRPNDCVCILSLSTVIYPILFLGILGAGGIVVGGNPGSTSFELEHLLSACKVKFVIVESSLVKKALEAAATCNISDDQIYVLNGTQDALLEEHFHQPPRCSSLEKSRSLADLLDQTECDWRELDTGYAASTTAAYLSTSGTSGPPKFAAVSHLYFIDSAAYIEQDVKSKPYAVSRLVSLPLLHAFASPLVHLAALRCGSPTYILSRFSSCAFVLAIQRFRVTDIPVVPSMLLTLLSSPLEASHLVSLKEVMSAGAPLTASVATHFGLLLPRGARLVQLYGLTEVGWAASTPWRPAPLSTAFKIHSLFDSISSLLSLQHFYSPLSTLKGLTANLSAYVRPLPANPPIGTALPSKSLLLVSANNTIITAPNTPGELLILASHPFIRYLSDPIATMQAFTDPATASECANAAYFRTGDVAMFSGHNEYYIIDRVKDIIKVRGWQVSPTEIEAVLLTHALVLDAAVLGFPDKVGVNGELPHAFVVLSVKGRLRPEDVEVELKRWVRSRLVAYKAVESVRFVDAIPRNEAGKILKGALRDKWLES